MKPRAVLIGMALWLSLLGLGVKWATNPMLKPPAPNLAAITQEETARAFPIHFAPLASKPAASHVPSAPPGWPPNTTAGLSPAGFEYETWAFQEMRRRSIAFLPIWIAIGLGILWGAARFDRKQPARC